VNYWIAWVAVLVQYVGVIAKIISKSDCNTDMGVQMIEGILGWGANYLSSEPSERILLLLRHFLRQSDNHSVASGSSSHCKTDSSVS
jgi:hypothetical protein